MVNINYVVVSLACVVLPLSSSYFILYCICHVMFVTLCKLTACHCLLTNWKKSLTLPWKKKKSKTQSPHVHIRIWLIFVVYVLWTEMSLRKKKPKKPHEAFGNNKRETDYHSSLSFCLSISICWSRSIQRLPRCPGGRPQHQRHVPYQTGWGRQASAGLVWTGYRQRWLDCSPDQERRICQLFQELGKLQGTSFLFLGKFLSGSTRSAIGGGKSTKKFN